MATDAPFVELAGLAPSPPKQDISSCNQYYKRSARGRRKQIGVILSCTRVVKI